MGFGAAITQRLAGVDTKRPRTQWPGWQQRDRNPFLRNILAGMRAFARQQLQDLAVRLRSTTPRERVLLAVLLIGAIVMAPVAAADWRAQQQDRYVNALMQQSSARLSYAAARRIEAAASDRVALEDMKTWGFSALNAEVAAVDIERRIFETATRAGLPSFSVATNAEPETAGPTQWMGAEVQADLRWNPAFDFLDSVAAWPEGFRVTQFSFTSETPSAAFELQDGVTPRGRLRIGLAFPVRLQEVTGPASDASGQALSGPGTGS